MNEMTRAVFRFLLDDKPCSLEKGLRAMRESCLQWLEHCNGDRKEAAAELGNQLRQDVFDLLLGSNPAGQEEALNHALVQASIDRINWWHVARALLDRLVPRKVRLSVRPSIN